MIKEKKKDKSWIGWIIAITILIIAIIYALFTFYSYIQNNNKIDVELVKCIGENCRLYVLPGCSHCATQEAMFGKNLDLLDIIDCAKNNEFCEGIDEVPTWICDENTEEGSKTYKGIKSIDELKVMSGCGGLDIETAGCTASKSALFIYGTNDSAACPECGKQLALLGKYQSLFNITDCEDKINAPSCRIIYGVPYWVFNNNYSVGWNYLDLNQIKNITGC